ncbi:MAG: Glu-tRNA(Gln) amidotransferase subunit GatD [Candidatus Heimdallarchaeota archaeon]|nr:MAG: Glu-tRNA(Gln) amidotransferase subunit GatD [Candidatus Heimdallarchaeota archaeon]
MAEEKYAGYRGSTLDWLKKQGLEVWDEIEVTKADSSIKGVILPRNELADPNFISLKLSTGYNIGFNIEDVLRVRKIGRFQGKYRIPKVEIAQKPALPFVPILGCGGTIASRLDYQTGGTIPALTPEELFSSFPEIAELARVETSLLFDIFSENISFGHYVKILTEIESLIQNDAPQGIVLTHGTDTLAFTAAALSFSITNPPFPIVITGSQRSSDRPSSDSFFNLYNSVLYAASPKAKKEVVVIMHEKSSDTSCTIHRGTRIRKMHSSRRDAFKTIGGSPLGRITERKISFAKEEENLSIEVELKDKPCQITKKFEEKVGLIYHYPGIQPGVLDYYIEAGYKGIVLAGTGLGHVSSNLIPTIKKANENEIVIVTTTQCLHGFTGLSVYESGRQLQKAGVVSVFNILPETAYIKLAYLLGNYRKTEKIIELMKQNLKGEITIREKFQEF